MTSSGAPLRDVSILLGLSPHTEMARTNNSGHFSMTDRCENSSYTLRKNDYFLFDLRAQFKEMTNRF